MIKNPPVNLGDAGYIPGLERPLGEGNGTLFQNSAARINSEIKRRLLFERKALTNLVYLKAETSLC